LIGPGTIDTVPNATLAAFVEHGRVRSSLDEYLYGARHDLGELGEVGIDLDQVTRELEVEGVEAFVKSYDGLLETITKATQKIESAPGDPMASRQTVPSA
jgi:transaldolase